jgi:hypothetical protein
MTPSPSPMVDWSIAGQWIDQLPAAVVVVNGPPFRGPLTTCRPRNHQSRHSLPEAIARWHAAILGYAVLMAIERVARQKRHRLAKAELGLISLGGFHVLP